MQSIEKIWLFIIVIVCFLIICYCAGHVYNRQLKMAPYRIENELEIQPWLLDN